MSRAQGTTGAKARGTGHGRFEQQEAQLIRNWEPTDMFLLPAQCFRGIWNLLLTF